MSIRIGISGWQYAPWRGVFYPKGLPQREQLSYVASAFPVVEINGSFYSLQRPASYERWYQATPKGFVFCVKGPRYITHMLRLKNIDVPLANFLASGLLALRNKLGPILWQFPPGFRYEYGRMRQFFALLPRDTVAATRLAGRHERWLRNRVCLETDARRVIRHAVEVRDNSFVDGSFIRLLRDENIALVVAESARHWPMLQDVTADFIYLRLHGDKELYRGGYGDAALKRWGRRIAAWARGGEPRDAVRVAARSPVAARERDVFCFFDNTDVKLRAPVDARSLMCKLKVQWPPQPRRKA
ncbi:MAG TPA: DUF72 domain-containing protein [Steroidobacteraceae bacterium]|jgi:uncharacterized protein YecE (DUF72 family)